MAARHGVRDPALGPAIRLLVGVGGLAMCITLLALGMRSVMDVGGMCAEGGPYEIAQTCPDGSVAATMIGMFGLFLFGGLGLWAGAQVGGAWTGVPLLAWTGLFGVLGWNFLDYGIVNPPEGETIVWGWLIPGVLFEIMAFGPLLLAVWALRGARSAATRPPSAPGGSRATSAALARPLPGPGQAARPAGEPRSQSRVSTAFSSPPGSSPAPGADRRAALTGIASALGAAIGEAAAETPADPARRDASSGAGDPRRPPGFSEGTQALLDRLERLADMRDRGLLSADDYETAKDAVMAELEARG